MKNLLIKELRLCLHPAAALFLLLSAMLLIPNYPYYVVFFYNGLGAFFICVSGRENNDVLYTMLLPVQKKDLVKARIGFIVLLELAQVLLAVPFAVIRQHMPVGGNAVGMDANIAFFGLSFLLLGLFNYVFFRAYYRDVNKVGVSFLRASIVEFLCIAVLETCDHIVPFLRDRLDTPDPQFLPEKLAVLAAGLLLFCLLTFAAYRKAARSFDAFDL